MDNPCSFENYCVLDFEACFFDGIYEVTDFPILLLDAHGSILDTFHRYAKPTKTDPSNVQLYITKKYGAMGLDKVTEIL
jgi:hypothetical protein